MGPFPDTPDIRSKSASAYEHLRRLAIRGHLRPGRRLSANDVAAYLQVSVTPVRDALVRLAADGFIRSEANRGYFTKSWTVREQRDLLGVLALHYVAGLEASDGLVVRNEVARLARGAEAADPSQAAHDFVDRLEKVYGVLVGGTKNAIALAMVQNALDRTRLIRRLDLEDPAERKATARVLLDVAEAMSRKDLLAAIARSRAHFDRMLPRLPRAVARANAAGQKLRFP